MYHISNPKYEYKIITKPSGLIGDLEREVNQHMSQGWSLVGGLVMGNGYCAQAVTRITAETNGSSFSYGVEPVRFSS